jgi:hypothetical protein
MSSRDISSECQTVRRLLSRDVSGADSSDVAVKFFRTHTAVSNINQSILQMALECFGFETAN